MLTNSSSESVMLTAKTWLEHCIQSHTSCIPERSTEAAARIINVGLQGDQVVTLEDCTGSEQPYMTPSYCWGMFYLSKQPRRR